MRGFFFRVVAFWLLGILRVLVLGC